VARFNTDRRESSSTAASGVIGRLRASQPMPVYPTKVRERRSRPRRLPPPTPSIQAALGNLEQFAHDPHRVCGLVRLHESEERFGVAGFSFANQGTHHRLLKRSHSDGKIGKTVVDQAQNGRSTSSATKRLGTNQLIPSGTAGASRSKSPNVRAQSDPISPHELKAWQSGGVHVRPLA
jgi:hypothetical protein